MNDGDLIPVRRDDLRLVYRRALLATRINVDVAARVEAAVNGPASPGGATPMPDVSRADYDAALKRLRAVTTICRTRPCDDTILSCYCQRATLAALGLDEPLDNERTADGDAR